MLKALCTLEARSVEAGGGSPANHATYDTPHGRTATKSVAAHACCAAGPAVLSLADCM
jgi:hypothetical protein